MDARVQKDILQQREVDSGSNTAGSPLTGMHEFRCHCSREAVNRPLAAALAELEQVRLWSATFHERSLPREGSDMVWRQFHSSVIFPYHVCAYLLNHTLYALR